MGSGLIFQTSLSNVGGRISSYIALTILVVNTVCGLLMPVLLAGVGGITGWVVAGVLGGILVLCPFVTLIVIAYLEDWIFHIFYSIPAPYMKDKDRTVNDGTNAVHFTVPRNLDVNQLILHQNPSPPYSCNQVNESSTDNAGTKTNESPKMCSSKVTQNISEANSVKQDI